MDEELTQIGPVLIVDDDPGVLELIATTLEAVGIVPRAASTYDEALAVALEERPAAAVLDIELPGRSGYELFTALRNEFGDSLPVIFVSGVRTESFDRVAGLLAGGDDFLSKPFDPEELVARIRAVLRRTAATA
jgi:DNA-binding response OmpR family regulator